jgi:hypothetical protein
LVVLNLSVLRTLPGMHSTVLNEKELLYT